MDTTNYIPIDTPQCGEPAIACPVCGCQHARPVQIECSSPGTATARVVINSEGIAIGPHQPPRGRGTHIRVRFHCKGGHTFEYALRFHKGITRVSRFMEDRREQELPGTHGRD